jgi:hypothetical protein
MVRRLIKIRLLSIDLLTNQHLNICRGFDGQVGCGEREKYKDGQPAPAMERVEQPAGGPVENKALHDKGDLRGSLPVVASLEF